MVNEDQILGDETTGGSGAGVAQQYDSPETQDVPEARRALVKLWIERVKADKKHHEKAFKRMRASQQIAAFGDAEGPKEYDRYTVPVLNRYVNTAVAALYAKNPTSVAKRKQKLMYKIWDGDPRTLQGAMQIAQQYLMSMMAQPPLPLQGPPQMLQGEATAQPGAIPPDVVQRVLGSAQAAQAQMSMAQPPMQPPQMPMQAPAGMSPMGLGLVPPPSVISAVELLQEVEQVRGELLMYDRLAETLKLLFAYYFAEQDCGYKEQLKALVRRSKVNGVAYIELGFQRELREDPDIAAKISDETSKLRSLETMLADAQSPDFEATSAEAEQTRLLLQDLQSQLEVIVREGPILSFPRSTEVIPDKQCRHLKTFAGARWVAREFDMDPDEVKRVYNVDLGKNYTSYKEDARAAFNKKDDKVAGCARVWRIQDKVNQQVLTVCDGYPDFLVEPSEPDVKIDRFWTLFALVFNEIECDDEIFPPSDVWNARHMQREYNTTREGLREHRIAARPKYAASAGAFEQADRKTLADMQAHEIVFLEGLRPDDDIRKKIQRIDTQGIDPNLYEIESVFQDIQRTTGAPEPDFGGTSHDTATAASIGEHSRQTSNGSDTDDLDDLLTALTRAMGQLMLIELSKDTVVEICGPGAVWPEFPPRRSEISKELYLDIEAGSSGRPNVAAELANLERAMPFMTQLPGINPVVPAKKYADLLGWNLEDTIVEGLPSIVALNSMMGRNNQAGGGPNDPNQQGDKGGQNDKKPDQGGDSQPAHPAPREATPGGPAPAQFGPPH